MMKRSMTTTMTDDEEDDNHNNEEDDDNNNGDGATINPQGLETDLVAALSYCCQLLGYIKLHIIIISKAAVIDLR